MKKYLYRREDNEEIVAVDFPTMLTQKNGYITLPCGVEARRCVHLEGRPPEPTVPRAAKANPAVLSEISMAFPAAQLREFEEDRIRSGYGGVEFVRDPTCEHFYQVKCDNRSTWDRYVKHRGLVDRNKSTCVLLSQEDLERATEVCSRPAGP